MSTTLNVGGILCNVYNQSKAIESKLPIGVLIATHGRTGSQADLKHLVELTLDTVEKASGSGGKAKRALIVVTFDQRNHGSRLVDAKANEAFDTNPNHALDMYATYTGTARDISFLVDFLPSYLFPTGETFIEEFFVTGVSLGGHATWLALKQEPRLKIGIPIIGCPDYSSLISSRIAQFKRDSPDSPQPIEPTSLHHLIVDSDPISVNYTTINPTLNPYVGKKILVLGGKDDLLVPPKFGDTFFRQLNVGKEGKKDTWIQEGKGHEVSDEMVVKLGEWVWEYGLKGGE